MASSKSKKKKSSREEEEPADPDKPADAETTTTVETIEKKSKKKKSKKDKKKREEKDIVADNNQDETSVEGEDGPASKRGKQESVDPARSEGADDKAVNDHEGNSGSNDDDDDEDDLLAAAAMWAESEEPAGDTKSDAAANNRKDRPGVDQRTQQEEHSSSSQQQQSFSLHITQLPFDTSDLDLRKFFSEHGCTCTSIRLVYDRDMQGNKTVFRGVAFVDLSDAGSYETALKLNHKASIRGRKLNIRPTRSKQELADIVNRTKELVQEKIRLQRSGEAGDSNITAKRSDDKNKKRKDKKSSKTVDRDGTKSGSDKKRKDPPKNEDGTPRKMTKKERNRKAAIIMGLKRRGKR
ncbi:MAG: hypothetical protein SGILL_000714 [Bacillariaceae sp.]